MNLEIDSHKLSSLRHQAHSGASADELRREGRVFFIGANLPVYSTLETMYESYCQESSELFHITFGDSGRFAQNLELVRQIKRNFSIRLMGRIGYHPSKAQVEQVYLAGLDMVDITISGKSGCIADDNSPSRRALFTAAPAMFSRWSVVSSILAGHGTVQELHRHIRELLDNGVMPLLDFNPLANHWNEEELCNSYRYIAREWHRYKVPLNNVMPLLRLTTPFVFAESSGFLRGAIDKLKDRRILAASNLRRHLRTRDAEASFESAGL